MTVKNDPAYKDHSKGPDPAYADPLHNNFRKPAIGTPSTPRVKHHDGFDGFGYSGPRPARNPHLER